jgi:hypothetical protein
VCGGMSGAETGLDAGDGPRHYSLTTCASQIDPLGIREYVEGLSDPGSSGSVEQNPRLCGCRNVWYVERNYGAVL